VPRDNSTQIAFAHPRLHGHGLFAVEKILLVGASAHEQETDECRSMNDFPIINLLFIDLLFFTSLFRQHNRRRFSTGHHSRN
jgi:hypothetical protein